MKTMISHNMPGAVLVPLFVAAVCRDINAGEQQRASNTVADVCVVAECETNPTPWSQASVVVSVANIGPLIRGRHDYPSNLGGIRVFLVDSDEDVMPRTDDGMNYMTELGDLARGKVYCGRYPALKPAHTDVVTVALSKYYYAPTQEACRVKVTFDTDIENPEKHLVVADLWANTNYWGRPSYSGPGEAPYTNMIAASYDGYGSIISNIHIEVTGLVIHISSQ